MSKVVLITGATSGIGKSTASLFARNGYKIIITGRRKDRLTTFANELRKSFSAQILPLEFDVRKFSEVEKHLGSLPDEFSPVDILINNAGLAVGMGPIQEGVIEDWDRMIDTNVKGLLYVSRVVIPQLVERKSGHIINIGSVAGKEAYPNGNVYCATKHAVDALSRSFRIDLLPHGIKVTNIAPGLVETEFSLIRYKGDEERAKLPYKGIIPLTADDIADCIYFAATRPAHVNLNDIVITTKAQAMTRDFIREG